MDDAVFAAVHTAGQAIGRYELVEELGSGGMGVVWRARDVELERDVAIKLLRRVDAGSNDSGNESRTRLVREARALAQLSHPNVVPVFDVGPTGEDEVWVAMEYVVGVPGNRWRDLPGRDWKETLAVYEQVGRGLAAAHAAGIVHRDFKPANFIVGDDRRVRVLDFGLARKQRTSDELAVLGGSFDVSNLLLTMTQEGALLGTPAYMSPEQMNGEVAGPASDQFSYAVSLWEALYGSHPFPAASFAELGVKIIEGTISAPTSNDVPPRIEPILRRALSVQIDDRFASMDEMLGALAPRERRRWPLVAAVGVAAAGVVAFALISRGSSPEAACPLDDDGWVAAVSSATAQTLRERFPEAADELIASLEAQRSLWIATRQQVCLASERGYQTSAVFNEKMACLAGTRSSLSELPVLVAQSEDDLVDRAQSIARRDYDPERCASALGAIGMGSLSPEEARIDKQIAAGRLRLALGIHKDARAAVEPAIEEAKALGSDALRAKALVVRGRAYFDAREYANAERDLREALTALSTAGDEQAEPEVWVALTHAVGGQGRMDEARGLATAAVAAIKRANQPEALGSLELALASFARREGKFADAVLHFERAREALAAAFGERSAEVANMMGELGPVQMLTGAVAEARKTLEEAVAIHTDLEGSRHPATLRAKTGLATALTISGDKEEAVAVYKEILAIQRERLGADDPATLDTLFKYAGTLESMKRSDEALAMMSEGVALRRKGSDKASLATALVSLGGVEVGLKRYAPAIEKLREALVLYTEISESGMGIVSALLVLANALRESGDCRGAQEPRQRAREILIKALGPAHEFTAITTHEAAECALAAGRYAEAAAGLEEAIVALKDKPHTIETHARAEISLAQALGHLRGRRAEARQHAERGLAILESLPYPNPDVVARGKAWLRANPAD